MREVKRGTLCCPEALRKLQRIWQWIWPRKRARTLHWHGRDELGHSRTLLVSPARAVSLSWLAPLTYGPIGMVQTVCCYYFTAHSTNWALDLEVYSFDGRPQHILDTSPLEPIT